MKKLHFRFIAGAFCISFLFLSCVQTKETGKVIEQTPKIVEWDEAESLKEVYVDSGIFENIGFAVPSGSLSNGAMIAGLTYHATTITAENDFKPDSLMRNFSSSCAKEKFTSSKGVTIMVPEQKVINFSAIDKYLSFAKGTGLKMRGHVLVWHSQTPKRFFCENYTDGKYVSKEEMDARQEWYIKSILEHVAKWEADNNKGKHIIYTWDVVNEAASDNCSTLRQESDWYQIYKNGEFIVNAFRYANKYAPKDVQLAYNDYNEYQGGKHEVILKILKDIIAAENDEVLPSRIDVMGMQSHMQTGFPSASSLDNTINHFISLGLDVQITELDITGRWLHGNTSEAADPEVQKKAYYDAFCIYRKYAKKDGAHGVTGVTLWGTDDGHSWRASSKPLIFEQKGSSLVTKPAFTGVIEASK